MSRESNYKLSIVLISITAIIITLGVIIRVAKASETDWVENNCYEYRMIKSGSDEVLEITIDKNLTHEKTTMVSNSKDEKKLNDLGLTIRNKLMTKVSDIKNVIVFPRRILIVKFRLPKDWNEARKQSLLIIDNLVCKGGEKKNK